MAGRSTFRCGTWCECGRAQIPRAGGSILQWERGDDRRKSPTTAKNS